MVLKLETGVPLCQSHTTRGDVVVEHFFVKGLYLSDIYHRHKQSFQKDK